MRWFELTLKGSAGHAGTMPMNERVDAMTAAIALAQQFHNYRDSQVADSLRLTLGRWQVSPNSINTIPGAVTFSVDARSVDEAVLNQFEAAMHRMIQDHD
ncbi:Allantoate amidohydrolase [Polaromonas vacuolata]|uniref:Allantoate amidohydrolase n=1 Tax=Polaromonas vacuolata TaxID=37448 RepID=A0A6H2HDM3_9BURK|nr:Allantoate amidohydrolase [Polaromonas vacuolata]